MEQVTIPFTDEERDKLLMLLANFVLASGNPVQEMIGKMKIKQHGQEVEERLEQDMVEFREAQTEAQAKLGLLN